MQNIFLSNFPTLGNWYKIYSCSRLWSYDIPIHCNIYYQLNVIMVKFTLKNVVNYYDTSTVKKTLYVSDNCAWSYIWIFLPRNHLVYWTIRSKIVWLIASYSMMILWSIGFTDWKNNHVFRPEQIIFQISLPRVQFSNINIIIGCVFV